MHWYDDLGANALSQVADIGMRIVGVLVALVVAWVVAGWVRRLMMRAFERAHFDLTLSRFFSALARYSIITLAVIACLGAFGIETASLAAVVAAAGLAIGLAFQNTLSNFAAGVMLLVFRPFKVGDSIVVGGFTGAVEEIELFTTELVTLDNRKIVVPNNLLFAHPVENITGRATRRCDLPIGTALTNDLDATRAALESAIAELDWKLAEPESTVFLRALTPTAVEWQLRIWCRGDDYGKTQEAALRAAKYALDRAGLTLAPPPAPPAPAPAAPALGPPR